MPYPGVMITVHTLPNVELDSQGQWTLVLWASQAFDYDAPLRAIVDEIADLFRDAGASVALPPWEPGEDFVDGRLVAGSHEFGVYLEYALGYIAFSSSEEAAMRGLEQRITPLVRLGVAS